MKNLKIKLPVIIVLFFSIILFNSCEKESDVITEQSVDNEFAKFKSAFPDLSSKISLKNIQKVNTASVLSKTTSNNIEGVTFPIIENELVIGRYIGLADESIALYIDFSDYTNKITAYDVNDPSQFQDFQMIYNSETGNYEVVNTNRGFWCGVACTIGAIAIALADGPSPLMDILAVAYQIACLADCASQ